MIDWKKFPHRNVTIDGRVHIVPRHIVRVHRGWQVRYLGTRFFGDEGRAMTDSFEAAKSYLDAIYVGPPPRVRTKESCSKKIPTGMAGVRVKRRHKGAHTEILVEVCHPDPKKKSIELWVGTENTLTPERLSTVLEEAKMTRLRMELEYRRSVRADWQKLQE